jgi:tripartite ATP-independent transporter DctM subunit
MEIAFLIGGFMLLLLLGVPCATAMLFVALIDILFVSELPITLMADSMIGSVNSFTLLAVPFFVLAGSIMNRAGVTARLINCARVLVGHFHGGTAQVSIVGCMFFSGISGSASADAAAIGTMMIPSMKREGYDPGFAAGVVASAATMGPIIPPSILMVIYGAVTNLSIGALFLAGFLPGVLIGLSLMIIVRFMAAKREYPRAARVPWRSRGPVFLDALPALLAPVIILGGMFSGMTTATEAGVIACAYGLAVGMFWYREIKLADLRLLLAESVEMTAIPMFIVAASAVFGFMLTIHGLGEILGGLLHGVTDSPTVFLLLVVVLLTIVGLFLDGIPALLIFVPVLLPLAQLYQVDPLHFALIVIIVIMIGTVTPPIGLQLYIAAAIARVPIGKVVAWPFVWAMTLVVVLLVFFPQLVTFVPRLFM